jgi:hypothetical protein
MEYSTLSLDINMMDTTFGYILLKLWIIQAIAALVLVAIMFIVRRPLVRLGLLSTGLALMVPVRLFSPDEGAIVPIGIFLYSLESFGLGIVSVAVAAILLFLAFWLPGWSIKAIWRTLIKNGRKVAQDDVVH